PLVSGGTTVTIPLLLRNQLPEGINHFRVGEALFFGKDLFADGTIQGMHNDVLELYSQVIEISVKPKVPTGDIGKDPQGNTVEINEDDYGKTSYRAILDIGYLEVNPDHLIIDEENVEIVDASSDMLILDVGDNKMYYEVVDFICFSFEYMGVLGILTLYYIFISV